MSTEEFKVAQQMEEDGWEFVGTDDTGDMVFTRVAYAVPFSATVKVDR